MALTLPHEFFFQWHLTERCNLRCRHCYQESARSGEMSLKSAFLVIEEVSEMLEDWSDAYGIGFFPSANISGGEPFLITDIFSILKELKDRGFDLHILTNGTLVDRDIARRLSDLGVRSVQVSIEGPEAVHEQIRGKGSYSSAMRGVENLLAEGVFVTLNATLSNINSTHFMDLVKLAQSAGVQRLGFSRLVPAGRGRGLIEESLQKGQLKELYEAIFALNPKGVELVTGDPVASQFSSPDAKDVGGTALSGCAAGVSGITLLSDGTVLPCRRLPIPLGNVREDSIREIWATSEALNSLRDRSRYRGKCAECPRWAVCRGCRAIAYAHGGNILSEDPGCFIEGNG